MKRYIMKLEGFIIRYLETPDGAWCFADDAENKINRLTKERDDLLTEVAFLKKQIAGYHLNESMVE